MPDNNRGELSFDLSTVLREVTKSVTDASKQLHDQYYGDQGDLKDHPYVYVIPATRVSLKMTIGYSNGKVKGIFKKTRNSENQELVSTVDLEIVSTPREANLEREGGG